MPLASSQRRESARQALADAEAAGRAADHESADVDVKQLPGRRLQPGLDQGAYDPGGSSITISRLSFPLKPGQRP
ncbi:hypothetical protein [Methylobacterium sp. PvR107]|uniref:hypothetical protein n=1 Tax=Methylobacterium sp. PvR107 TaxID=2806597 RepID=UPI001AE9D54C|nr:hypothetical protein [Methylobacterium sp. PvR107]MBP1183796.1 hypothetical protein [Methylobacterium sp. PvR107]